MGKSKLTERQKFDALDMMDGQTSDAEIGRLFGVNYQVIGALRRKNGIPSVYAPTQFQPTESQLAELHEYSNREMRRKYGTHADTWAKVRKRYGIPNYRPATTIQGEPQKWSSEKEKSKVRSFRSDYFKISPLPARDTSLAGEAQSFLQRAGWHCFDRKKIGIGDGWQVGRNVMDKDSMIAFAKKRGFEYAY